MLPLAVAVFKVTAPFDALLTRLAIAWTAAIPGSVGQIALPIPMSLVATFAVPGTPAP